MKEPSEKKTGRCSHEDDTLNLDHIDQARRNVSRRLFLHPRLHMPPIHSPQPQTVKANPAGLFDRYLPAKKKTTATRWWLPHGRKPQTLLNAPGRIAVAERPWHRPDAYLLILPRLMKPFTPKKLPIKPKRTITQCMADVSGGYPPRCGPPRPAAGQARGSMEKHL